MNISGEAAIIGIGATDFMTSSSLSAPKLAARALASALADAGASRDEIDGLAIHTGAPWGVDYDHVAPMLGLNVRHVTQYWSHGRWITTAMQNAALAVVAGLADLVAVITVVKYAEATRIFAGGPNDVEGERDGGGVYGQSPAFGLTSPHAGIALATRSYFEQYSLPDDCLMPIVASSREHAMRNPRALIRQPLDTEAYLAEPFIMDPIRRSDCFLENDVAVVALIASADRAKSYSKAPVYLKGMQGMRSGREEFLFAPRSLGVQQQALARAAAEVQPHQVYEVAGLGPNDMDGLYTYDIFSPLIPFVLERFGHCEPGTGPKFAADGQIAPGGRLPVNTSGGMLSEGYACGWNSIAEIVRQIRGEAGDTQLARADNLQFATCWGDSIIFGSGR